MSCLFFPLLLSFLTPLLLHCVCGSVGKREEREKSAEGLKREKNYV
jgi:hypothetical protein